MSSPVSSKSQSHHKLSLHKVKWSNNQVASSSHHRGRGPGESSSSSLQPRPLSVAAKLSPLLDLALRESAPSNASPHLAPMHASSSKAGGSRPVLPITDSSFRKDKNMAIDCGKDDRLVKSDKKSSFSGVHVPGEMKEVKPEKKSSFSGVHVPGEMKEVKSKTYCRLRINKKPEPAQLESKVPVKPKVEDETIIDAKALVKPKVEDETIIDTGGEEEFVVKSWNLRPRKPLRKSPNSNAGTSNAGGATPQGDKAQSPEKGDSPAAKADQKKKKKTKLSISLSRQEIEDDFLAMTGSKPSRRPKRRPKVVQKTLNNIFPGLWLGSITPDLYKVSEPAPKG